jgi:hypothetical protein
MDAHDHDVQLAAVYGSVPEHGRDAGLPQPQAEVIVNLTAPFPSWRWLKLQLLRVNWATLALLVAVLGVSSNINEQLNTLRQESGASLTRYNDLHGLMTKATKVAGQLGVMNDELHAYSATLQQAMALGITNLTGDISALRSRIEPVANKFLMQTTTIAVGTSATVLTVNVSPSLQDGLLLLTIRPTSDLAHPDGYHSNLYFMSVANSVSDTEYQDNIGFQIVKSAFNGTGTGPKPTLALCTRAFVHPHRKVPPTTPAYVTVSECGEAVLVKAMLIAL